MLEGGGKEGKPMEKTTGRRSYREVSRVNRKKSTMVKSDKKTCERRIAFDHEGGRTKKAKQRCREKGKGLWKRRWGEVSKVL